MKKEDEFKKEIRKVLKSEPLKGDNRVDLMVLKWARAGKSTLEKRQVWTVDGEDRLCRMHGLKLEDVQFILQHGDEILKLMED